MARDGKLFSSTLFLGGASFVSKFFALLLLPFYTAELSVSEFGVVELFISSAVLLVPLASLCAPQAVFRFSAQKTPGSVLAGACYLLLGALIFAFLIPFVGMFAPLRPYLWLFYCYVLASVCRSFAAQLLRAKGLFALFGIQQIFCAILTALLQVLFLYRLHMGVRGYLLAVVLGDAITFFVLLFCASSSFLSWEKPSGAFFFRMGRYALPLIPSAVLWWLMSASERYFLVYYHGKEAMGIYGAACRFPGIIGFAVGLFLEVWHYAVIREQEDKRGELFGHVYSLMMPIMILLGGMMMALSPFLVKLFLADEYKDAARILPFLILSAVCAGACRFLDSVYTVCMRSLSSLLGMLPGGLLHILCCFLLVPVFGAVGAGIASAFSFGALLFFRLWHTGRYLFFKRSIRCVALSYALAFLSALLFSANLTFFATVMSLISVLPLAKNGFFAMRFLGYRLQKFLHSFSKKRNAIEKEDKI